jgi:hypothetical protein
MLDSAPALAIIAKGKKESAMTGMQRKTYHRPTLLRRGSLPLVAANAASNGG